MYYCNNLVLIMTSNLVTLITLWEEFSTFNTKVDIKDFAHWLLQNDADRDNSGMANALSHAIKENVSEEEPGFDESAKAMLLINRVQRLMQMKVKPIIKKLGFTRDHEYSMLTHIYLLKTPNKKELAQHMLLENTTAVEITNRLLKRGYIKEVKADSDKRSTRIGLTEIGNKKLFESYTYMRDLPATFLNCLKEEELMSLVYLMNKIDRQHSLSF